MALSFEMPEEIGGGGGNFLREPGKFHFVATKMDESPSWPSGEPIDGYKVVGEVLADTKGGQCIGQEAEIIFSNPNPLHKDGGAFGRKKIAACMVALGFAGPVNMGKSIDADLEEGIGRQFFAELELRKDESGEVYLTARGNTVLELAFANIYHVDDPAAKNYPRDEASLAAIPAAHRITDPAFFDAIRGKKPKSDGDGGNGSAKAAPKPTPKPTSPAMAAVSTDLGDL